MAQRWRVTETKPRRPRPALDREGLERLAVHYVGRYATSRAKLVQYLGRKLRERGWAGEDAPDLAALAQRLADAGFIDDGAYAEGRARSLGGRGYGARRLTQTLHAAGIEEEDARPARRIAEEGRWAAALRCAQKRRIGPYAAVAADRSMRERWIAAMLRAGHGFAAARTIASSPPGAPPDDPEA